jgi:hypothetical protein
MKKSITKLPAIMERTKAMAVVLLLVLATSIPHAMGTEGNIRGLSKNTPKNAIQMWAERVNAKEGTKDKKTDEKIVEKIHDETDEKTVEKTVENIDKKFKRTRGEGRARERVRTAPVPELVVIQDPQPKTLNNNGPPQLEQNRIGQVEDPCALGSVSGRHCGHYKIWELNQNYNPKSLDKPVCRSTSNASFGSLSKKSAMIEFVYEMEVDIKNADNVVFGQVVPKIEQALTDSLLPVFFEDDCSEYNPQVSISRRRLLEGSSGVIGISGMPYDTEKQGTFVSYKIKMTSMRIFVSCLLGCLLLCTILICLQIFCLHSLLKLLYRRTMCRNTYKHKQQMLCHGWLDNIVLQRAGGRSNYYACKAVFTR